jgi:hypothetical protein
MIPSSVLHFKIHIIGAISAFSACFEPIHSGMFGSSRLYLCNMACEMLLASWGTGRQWRSDGDNDGWYATALVLHSTGHGHGLVATVSSLLGSGLSAHYANCIVFSWPETGLLRFLFCSVLESGENETQENLTPWAGAQGPAKACVYIHTR